MTEVLVGVARRFQKSADKWIELRKEGSNMKKSKTTANRESLVGQFFHSFNDEGHIVWQGEILKEPRKELYLVQTFSWVDGSPVESVLVPLDDMRKWKFYPDADAMNWAYEKQKKRDK
jgi:hypothetical protein